MICEKAKEKSRKNFSDVFFVTPSFDPGIQADIREHFDKYYTIHFENYPVPL
jgi:formylmethanofuran dehydrogenase subunit A